MHVYFLPVDESGFFCLVLSGIDKYEFTEADSKASPVTLATMYQILIARHSRSPRVNMKMVL